MKNKKYNIVSLFSGAGGMDLGFQNKGFNIVWANDFNSDAVNTYRKNIGDHIVLGDITKISTKEITNNKDIDVVIGGFPCQGFSIANKNRSSNGMDDKRNFLYLELLRVIKEANPKFFIAENVKGLLSIENGEVIKLIVKDFQSLGYKVDYKVLNAAEYGVPQARERVIIMGNRLGMNNVFPAKTHGKDGLLPLVSTKKAIGFLQNVKITNGRVKDFAICKGQKIYNHIANTNISDKFWGRKYNVNQFEICDYLKLWRDKSGISTSRIDEIFGYKATAGHWFRKDNNCGSIPQPEDWKKLKGILGFDEQYDEVVTTFIEKDIKFEQSLRITNWNTPSDTITATSPEIHVNKKRRLSVRECAILQTFPMDFVFTGSMSNQYKQVGNAVPVVLAEKIAETILNCLNKNVLNNVSNTNYKSFLNVKTSFLINDDNYLETYTPRQAEIRAKAHYFG